MALSFILGLFAYRELRTITTQLNFVETSDDITNNLLEMRRHEKNFLLFRDTESLDELMRYLTILNAHIDEISAEIIAEIGKRDYEIMKEKIGKYESNIKLVAENAKQQGMLEIRVGESARNIEQHLNMTDTLKFSLLRKHEKNIMLFKNQESFDDFIRTVGSFPVDDNIIHYQLIVRKLYDLYKYEIKMLENMRETAREIQAFTEKLSRKERKNIDAVLVRGMQFLLASFVIIVFIGIFINRNLARKISLPIITLNKATKRIANGNYTELIEVKGNDEVATLSVSFNQMAMQINNSMRSLELAIERLHEKQGQLIEAEKLASIGKLAAGIAHEINNPLTSVLTFSSLMLEQMQPDDRYYKRLQMIVRETTRARDIVGQVLSYARETPLRLEQINVNRTVSEIIESFKYQHPEDNIALTVTYAEDLPSIYIDPVRIGQVIMNILQNAFQAITPPGNIRVSTGLMDNYIEIMVADTGRGIPAENLNRIFDPFFTTKEQTNGTGLGLAVSYGIIKRHGGSIEVQSALGQGTTFIVRLPVAPAASIEPADNTAESSMPNQISSGN